MRLVAYALLCAALIAGALLVAGAPPAKAAEASQAPAALVPKKADEPLCGKTVPECEKKNNDLMAQLAAMQGVIQTQAREMKNYQTLLTEANDRWAAANGK